MQLPHQEELNRLEEQVRRLKIQYDMFFRGNRKLPPAEDRKRCDEAIFEMGKGRLRDNTSRFRYNSINARYNRYKELWGRQLREREEGPTGYRERQAAYDEAPGAPSGEQPRPRETSTRDESYVRVTVGSNGDAIRALHEQIAAANKEVGKAAPTAQQVSSLVAKQLAHMKERYNSESVALKVETVDGKVRLRAKPLTR